MDLSLSGLASGFDWKSFVDEISSVERVPQQRLLLEQNTLEERNNAYRSIATQLNVLKNRVDALKSPELFNGRTVSVGDSTAASASVSSGAVQGTYTFSFSQLATAAKQVGTSGVGKALNDDDDVSGLTVSGAAFGTAVTAGSFRVNGKEVTISTSDTLEDVFDRISDATDGAVTGSYNPATDRIELESDDPIVLGGINDTSNFLQAAKLYNNGTGTVSSGGALGSVRLGASLAESNLTTAVTTGGTGTGSFRINGVTLEFTATDSISQVLTRINDSSAGVTASYDSVNDRFLLTNDETGDVGIAMEDVAGNFLAATGLSGGTLNRGKDLLYTIDGGGTLRSRSNTISAESSGLSGVSVTALAEGKSTTVKVGTNTAAIKQAITDFISAYNGAQSFIASQTASSTAADGKVTAKVLTADGDAEGIAGSLRRMAYGPVTTPGLSLSHLESLGIKSNSDDDTLELEDSSKLEAALANNLTAVRELFTDGTDGVATRLSSYLERTAGENGSLASKQDLLTRQATAIDTQIADLERIVQANRERLTASFVAMETAQANINQQLQFLTQRFGS